MGLEIIIPFLASVAVTIGLRRLDKSNTKLSQIKRYAEKLSEEIHQTAVVKIQSVKDAGIDIDLHLKQARKTSEDIQKFTRESRDFLDEIKSTRDYLASLSEEMTEVVGLAHEAKKESESIQRSRVELGQYQQELDLVRDDMNSLREETGGLLQAFQEKLDRRSDDMLQSLAHKLIDLEALLAEKSDALDQTLAEIGNSVRNKLEQETEGLIQDTVGRVDLAKREAELILDRFAEAESGLELKMSKFEDTSALLSEKVDRFEERLEEKTSKAQARVEEKVFGLEKKLTERFDRVLEQAAHSKETFLEGIRLEVDSIKREIEGLSLETMTRRDEILNETRRQAENLNSVIIDFQEKYLDAENRLLKQADSRKAELMRQMESFAEEFRGVSEELKQEAEKIRTQSLTELRDFQSELSQKRRDWEDESSQAILRLRGELEEKLKTDFSKVESSIQGLEDLVSHRLGEVDQYVGDIKEALTESARDILDEAEKRANSFEDLINKEVANTEKKVESMISFWGEELKKSRELAATNLSEIQSRIQEIHLDGSDMVEKIKEEFQDQKKKLQEFLKAKEGGLEEESRKAQEDLTERFQILRKTAEDFFSRQELKVDKLNENIDNRINKQLAKLVDKGNLHLGQIEEKVQKHIASLKRDLDTSFQSNREEFKRFQSEIQSGIQEALELKEEILGGISGNLGDVKEEVSDLLSKINGIKSELSILEETKELVERSQEMKAELEQNLANLDLAAETWNETRQGVRELMELRDQVSSQLVNLKQEFGEIQSMESHTENLSIQLNRIESELATWKDHLSQVQEWEIRMEKALESQEILKESLKDLDSSRESVERIRELQEFQLESTGALQDRIAQVTREIERVEIREKELKNSIQTADNRARHLMDREKEILAVESRFEKIESLLADLSERHKQTLTLQTRVEDLRKQAERSKEDLEGVLSEADEKFDKLSAFLDIVQSSTQLDPRPGSSKGRKQDPILERKRNTVLSLYEKHQWTPEVISDKLGIEKSLVDTILGARKSS
jgi:chromosome segregation ATPase